MTNQRRDSTAALVIIGAEVLSGKVEDANTPFLVHSLRQRGVEVCEIRVIGDTVEAIASAVRALSAQVGYVLTTGGIGPTHDDVTIAGVAAALGRRVVRHPPLTERLRAHYGARLREAHLKMAEIPEGATVHIAEGIAPIIAVENIYVFPGVPAFLRTCFAAIAASFVGRALYNRALLLDIGESEIAAHLRAVQERYPTVAIGSYPRFDGAPYRVKVTVDGRDEATVDAAVAALRTGLAANIIVGEERNAVQP